MIYAPVYLAAINIAVLPVWALTSEKAILEDGASRKNAFFHCRHRRRGGVFVGMFFFVTKRAICPFPSASGDFCFFRRRSSFCLSAPGN
jgi:hypothetical protein